MLCLTGAAAEEEEEEGQAGPDLEDIPDPSAEQRAIRSMAPGGHHKELDPNT